MNTVLPGCWAPKEGPFAPVDARQRSPVSSLAPVRKRAVNKQPTDCGLIEGQAQQGRGPAGESFSGGNEIGTEIARMSEF